jgi:hypothetical protein
LWRGALGTELRIELSPQLLIIDEATRFRVGNATVDSCEEPIMLAQTVILLWSNKYARRLPVLSDDQRSLSLVEPAKELRCLHLEPGERDDVIGDPECLHESSAELYSDPNIAPISGLCNSSLLAVRACVAQLRLYSWAEARQGTSRPE